MNLALLNDWVEALKEQLLDRKYQFSFREFQCNR